MIMLNPIETLLHWAKVEIIKKAHIRTLFDLHACLLLALGIYEE